MVFLRRGLVTCALLAVVAFGTSGALARPASPGPLAHVIVTLAEPPLAHARAGDGVLLSRAGRGGRLSLTAPSSAAYLARLNATRAALEGRLADAIPAADVHWRYSLVANGFSVVLPARELARLERLPGVARVWPNARYSRLLDRSPAQIGAPALWGPALATAGQGMKIAIIDDGVDQTHPFFDPRGFAMPAGFPKGNTRYTTAKVVVARAFPPPGATYPNASLPFDPAESAHGTHVAGIAAGNSGTVATSVPGRPVVSGIAPRAYLGNYKVLTIPTPRVGLDGNAAEIAAAIEAAVRDGMDVINLSLGEPEIDPRRDLVTRAIDAAAAAGVVPAIAGGNDFDEYGRGSIGSPGSAAAAITAGAVSTSRSGTAGTVASFSSSGPTPISLRLKPDVAAPGLNVLSSVPAGQGTWAAFSGTSMASPHVAGAAALLRQRHPTWTVAQIKSALATTGDPAFLDGRAEAPPTREGGGIVNLPRANDPKLFAAPSNLSFGFVRPRATARRAVQLTDAGAGAGQWTVALEPHTGGAIATVTAPATVTVPGTLTVTATTRAAEGESMGFVVFTRGADRRRIAYWLRVAAPRLAAARRSALSRTGTYGGDTRGRPARVTTYRYPENVASTGVPVRLAGPEQVFRVRLRRPVANLGVAILSQARGVAIEPRIVVAGDENRLTGYTALPLNLNPYTLGFGSRAPIVAALRPAGGAYDIVFDTTSRARAGRFTFRFWLNDVTPPAARVLSTTREVVRVRVTDSGSGVDPRSLVARIDGLARDVSYSRRRNLALVDVAGIRAGTHALVFQVSDHQEAKNNENVPPILPNTRTVRASVRIR